MSFQTFLHNTTPFTAEKFVLPDKEGQEMVLLVVSATFQQPAGRAGMELALEQLPIDSADRHNGPPQFASVRREGDVALEKPFVDVLVNGFAHAPGGRPASTVTVNIAVGDVRKELLVSGNRNWRKGSFGSAATSPEPFVRMPVLYERAFGGMDTRAEDPRKHGVELRNLSGLGYRGARSYDSEIRTELPNIEYPNDRQRTTSDMPAPAGLGVVSRSWQPRLGFAGTYDEAWLAQQWPLLPADFDPRHYQAAPADQQSSRLRGGEPVTLSNLTPEGQWNFRLPTLAIPALLIFDDHIEEMPLRMDTVFIDAEAKQVTLTNRASYRTRRNRPALREIVLGRMTPAWMLAHRTGKRFISMTGRHGVMPAESSYSL